jgi:hypothetical protein
VNDSGIVNVTLRAYYGGCFSDSTKTVTIYYQDGEIHLKQQEEMPLILGYKAFPNPNDGKFQVQVKLSRKTNIVLKIYGLRNTGMLLSKELEGLDKYDIPFDINNLPTGVYVLILTAEKEQQSLKLVISH